MIASFPLKEEELELKDFLSLVNHLFIRYLSFNESYLKEGGGGGWEGGERSNIHAGNYII